MAGSDVPGRFRGTDTEIGGFLDVLEAEGCDVSYLPSLWLLPAGLMTADAQRAYFDEVAAGLSELGRADGILVSLHGCTATRDEPDVSGAFLKLLRRSAGEGPIVATPTSTRTSRRQC